MRRPSSFAGSLTVAKGLVVQLGIYVYNFYFHPLSKYPGPFWCGISYVPASKAIVTGVNHQWHSDLHRKYGDVVRTNPETLSFCTGKAWKDIHGFKKKGEAGFRKDPSSYLLPPNGIPSLLTAKDDAHHARLRRVFSHAFSDRALKQQEPLFTRYIDQLVRNLEAFADQGEDVDMVQQLNFTTFDIMGDLTFGAPLGLLDKSEYTPWVTMIFATLKLLAFARVTKNFAVLSGLTSRLMPKSLMEKRLNHFKFSCDQVNTRLEKKDLDSPDIWGIVLKQEGERALSLGEMHSSGGLVHGGRHRNNGHGTQWPAILPAEQPGKNGATTREIRGAFDTGSDVNMEGLARLPYMHACIEEGLRMYPPVPAGLPRVPPPEGGYVDGIFVPGGVSRLSVL